MMSWIKSLWGWVDRRMPMLEREWKYHMAEYYAPKNFNFWYFFGVLSLVVLVVQLVTGIWLLMNYEASAERAFASVEYIMRDVEMGWMIRYMHSTGASAFFVVVYMHMFRGLLYGSYRAPRELVWIFGMSIYLVLVAESFLGYVLPWGQMSYWGAQVIISLVGAIPLVGEALVEWVRGDYLISGITLNRFMALHVVALPIILLALVVLHILALHEVGSNNPDGIEIKNTKDSNGKPRDGIPFFPFYLPVHDLPAVLVFLFVFCTIMFFFPEMGGYFIEYANFEEANPLKTPEHIAPVWYFTPFYSMLRAITFDVGPITSKFGGFIVMAGAIAIMFVLPWLDRSPVKSIRYKGLTWKTMILLFSASFIILGVLGVKAPTPGRTVLAQLCTLFYFVFFLAMPWWSRMDTFKQPPERVTMRGLGFGNFAAGLAVVLILSWVPLKVVGAESAYECGTIECEAFKADAQDTASLQRGAKWYMNYCYGCHATRFARYERVADDLGIPHEVALDNLLFTEQKIGELMVIAMPLDNAAAAFGAPPPDLTLVARARGADWVYTYLKNFHRDDARPLGVNNRVFKDVGMPHVLLELQGLPSCVSGHSSGESGAYGQGECSALEVQPGDEGSMSAEEFDQVAYDLTNFLAYMADPVAEERKQIGTGVLLFLGIFFVFAWLLNREYWRDLH